MKIESLTDQTSQKKMKNKKRKDESLDPSKDNEKVTLIHM